MGTECSRNKNYYCSNNECTVYDQCLPHQFNSGYHSHIRGAGSGNFPHKIFPGTQQVGNESGANGPLYASNPNEGLIVEVDRRHGGGHPWHKIYPVRL